jgi:hypothetical protein
MIWAIVLVVLAADLTIMGLVFWGIARVVWNGPFGAYHSQPVAPDAVTGSFQTFRVGLANLGGCVHVAADEACLHLTPVRPLRWLGARAASIPWDAIRISKRSRNGRWITAHVGRTTLQGPAWCLGLAEPVT